MANGSSDTKTTCDVCGQLVDPQEIQYDDRTGQHLCAECLAEEKSCGCSDD